MKFLGRCPCPRCLVTKDKVRRLGTKLDRWIRNKKARIDDAAHRGSIESARKLIFEFGRTVVGAAVERIIGENSLVPTRVCIIILYSTTFLTHSLERFF